jgi:Ca-activated chloride channel family protein
MNTQSPDPTPEYRSETAQRASASPVTRPRTRLAVLLLAMTMIGGLTAQVWGKSQPPTPTGTLPIGTYSANGTGTVHFDGRLDRGSILAGGDGQVRMELSMRADTRTTEDFPRVATDLVVVLDRSGSMRGSAIEHALASVRELITQLDRRDRFSLVTYASDARVTIPLAAATPDARNSWLQRLDRINATGGTNMSGGLDLAASTISGLRAPGRVPRIILLSDGHANEGDASYAGLVGRAGRAVPGEYVLSTVGVGEGFDEALMTSLSDAGTGNFYYVRRSHELDAVFSGEFASARETVASGLEVRMTPRPGVSIVSAAGYPLEAKDGVVRFRPGGLFAGQERRIWVNLQIASQGAGDVAAIDLGDFELAYSTPSDASNVRHTLRLSETPRVAQVASRETFIADVDKGAWERSVVEEEFGALKQSVARSLRARSAPAAMASMKSFKAKMHDLNSDMGSSRVAKVLSDIDQMEEEVAAASEAKDEAVSNRLRKQYEADGYNGRRQGAKY